MGLTWDGRVLGSRFGTQQVGDIRAAALQVLRRVLHVQEVWFLVLSLAGRVGWWEGSGA